MSDTFFGDFWKFLSSFVCSYFIIFLFSFVGSRAIKIRFRIRSRASKMRCQGPYSLQLHHLSKNTKISGIVADKKLLSPRSEVRGLRRYLPICLKLLLGSNFNCCTALGKNLSVVTLRSDLRDMSRSSGFAFWAMMEELYLKSA